MLPCVVSAVLTTFLTTEFFWPCWLPCFENYGTDVSLLIECSISPPNINILFISAGPHCCFSDVCCYVY